MSNPVTLVVVAGLATGAGKTIAEKTWSLGEKWIKARFGDHLEKARERAVANGRAFVDILAAKVEKLEADSQLNTSVINTALEEPSFSALLQRSMLAAAQTSSADRHQVLATLIASRLSQKPEGMAALAAPL